MMAGVASSESDAIGWAPDGFRLPATTRLGPVVLQIGDLDRSLAFYRTVLGLDVLRRDRGQAVLGGASGTPLITLREQPGARPKPRERTGLFHVALLLPDRADLGRFIRHLDALGIRPGAADHQVSEAIYLDDPDRLGIEIYADRPRDVWQRRGRELVLTTEPLDRPSLLAAAGDSTWSGMPAGTVVGHMHLQVGDLARAGAFFSDALGLDRMAWSTPGALFLGAGGYHHHLGTNVWAGRGVTSPTADEAQLLEWTIVLPDRASLDEAAASLRTQGAAIDAIATADKPVIRLRDPWQTTLRLEAEEADPGS